MTKAIPVLGRGYFYDQMPVGFQFRSMARTITEPDLTSFVNLTWLLESVFVDQVAAAEAGLAGRMLPGMLVYSFAEGLVAPSLNQTGQAFLGVTLDLKRPTFVGDTIHVVATVTECRPASKGNRALVRTSNDVVNQRGEIVLNYTPLRLVAGSDQAPTAGRSK